MGVGIGLVGTGYVARMRAIAFAQDARSHLVAVSGSAPSRTQAFAETHGLSPAQHWQQVVTSEAVDLVVVATVSNLHGEVVQAALAAGKHVVVEYPLSLDVAQAAQLVEFARLRQRLLHVEHIELLGGLHLAMRSHFSHLGRIEYARYRTLTPKRPAPKSWKYHREQFGFPFCGALSRVHRLTNLLGAVEAVDCCSRVDAEPGESAYFKTLWSSARLQFATGAIAELTYGKGEGVWLGAREIELQGRLGALTFTGNEGTLTTAEGCTPISVQPRRGLLAQDTQAVLDHLTTGRALYVSAEDSLYALKVGDALRRASETRQTVRLGL